MVKSLKQPIDSKLVKKIKKRKMRIIQGFIIKMLTLIVGYLNVGVPRCTRSSADAQSRENRKGTTQQGQQRRESFTSQLAYPQHCRYLISSLKRFFRFQRFPTVIVAAT